MKIVSIIGTGRKSGKTYLIERLIKELRKIGIRFAVVKKIHKENFTIDKEGKDTYRYALSGAKDIFIFSRNEIVHIKKTEDFDKKYLLNLLKNLKYDLVIIEGNFDCENKIIVIKDEKVAKEIIERDKNVRLLVSKNLSEINGRKCLDIDKDFEKILEYIIHDIK